MTRPAPNITVNVDVTNPGQFFACCGLLELADRLWPGAEGWFEDDHFMMECGGEMAVLLKSIHETNMEQLEPDNDTASPMLLGHPFNLTLSWWNDTLTQGHALKVWAGSMRSVRIAGAMQRAIADAPHPENIFGYRKPIYDPDNPRKKVEPFYFDSRRGWNAQSLDIGFAPDSFGMTTAAFPAVEFLCLVGLQRFRPAQTDQRRVFDYCSWRIPLPPHLASAAAAGSLPGMGGARYRFENAFRTDQKKHKSFLPATPLESQNE